MTFKTVITIELKDIKAIEFECGACHTKVVYPIEKFSQPLMTCNVCQPNKQFFVHGGQDVLDLMKMVKTMHRFSDADMGGLVMRFDITNPSVSRAGDAQD